MIVHKEVKDILKDVVNIQKLKLKRKPNMTIKKETSLSILQKRSGAKIKEGKERVWQMQDSLFVTDILNIGFQSSI